MKHILIVDDEPEMLKSLEKILSHRSGFNLTLIDDGQRGIELASTKKYDLVITDLKMNKVSGIDVLKSALSSFPETHVVVISGYGTIEASVEAMREGAFDFIEKPFTSKRLFEVIDRALKKNNSEEETEVQERTNGEENFKGIYYRSNQMAEQINLVRRIAPGHMNVLITGESGTGKELFARAIHALSSRSVNPFVPVNCGALPENLFESELFGHERGAFTGATKTKPGLLEFADTGTFFFDEIGDMSFALQAKLLRMLEDSKIRRVGGQKEIEIDVRIIAATNLDMEKAVAEKKFRQDLFYRLNTIRIEIPSLRERKEDILLLANHYLADLCNKNTTDKKFSVEAEKALIEYPWVGNVRELQNIISRAYFLCSGEVIHNSDLPISSEQGNIQFKGNMLNLPFKQAKDDILEKFEIEYLTYHLKQNHGNISKTAEICGLDRRSIHRLIKKFNIVYQ